MNYRQMVELLYQERNKIDEAVEGIVRLNGKGKLFRLDTPAVMVEQHGDNYQLVGSAESIFAKENFV